MVVKVCVDVRCGAEIAVPQPFLDLLHRNAVGQQKAGTAVPKVVQTNNAHAVGFQDALEAAGKRVGLQPFTQLIHTDVIKVIRAIGASAQPPVVGLFLFLDRKSVV